ncbi:MAG: hypothetical protein H0W61_02340 [Bacteroidetes bacterium]|nr:hypothetical protein [Bacteroidota bacterium]
MKTIFFALFFSCVTFSFKSQTKNQHLAGINLGYSTWPKMIGYKFESNFNYFYAYKHFCSKFELGIAPGTNFGNFERVYLNFGYTTDLNTGYSWHAMLGVGGTTGNKTFDRDGYTYDFVTSGVLFSSGVYYRPSFNRFAFGLHYAVTKYIIYPTGEHPTAVFVSHTTTGKVSSINFSASYKLNRAKQKKVD